MIRDEIVKHFYEETVYSGLVPNPLTLDYPLISTGILDSLGLVTLLSFLEERFKFSVETMELKEDNFKNLKCLIDFVKLKSGIEESNAVTEQ